ncbi:DUF4396 domain-containing protein [Gryllotalpicola reticulitermitis]|uniref:DUF4396 domain-containing protein n=1 Tax=Gryllotalpicola reticulitermitis TaxID=1184153 RepID=A0ABV8Q9X0_9MICO
MTELTNAEVPVWLTVVATLSLIAAVGCAVWTAVDVARRPQRTAIMNLVWPITALFGSGLWVWLYRRYGRAERPDAVGDDRATSKHPRWASIAIGTTHCGAGCALGDLIAEFAIVMLPVLAVAVGWHHLYEVHLFAAWIWDLVLAFVLGIVFQYFAIAPMRDQPRRRSLRDALKADTFSILAWQLGMYGTMAIIQFLVARPLWGGMLPATTAVFWLGMQLAMLVGFACSYPVNAVLIQKGIKEAM